MAKKKQKDPVNSMMKARKAKVPANGQGPTSSKKGLIIGIVVLVIVIAAAAIAYNALAPKVDTGSNLRQTGASAQSSAAASSAASGTTGNATGDSATSAGSTGSASDGYTGSGEEVVEAPDFSMKDANGNTVKLSQYFGKPIVLNFWASTCGPCQREMPSFQSAYEELGDEVQFMMVDVVGFNGESEARAKNFIQSNGYTFPVFFDINGEATVPYGLSSIPQSFFIDRDGNVVATASGSINESLLQQGIEMIR